MSTKEYIEPEALLRGLSETIRQRRKVLKISQEDLSRSAGFARGYLSDIERGARSFSIKNLARLSNVLKTCPSALLSTTEK
ncbi:MAG TPA: helix-turn-helix transcriptional regulator, partial [Candidatus Obscuribacter sp.]|nr:helix-turn-helix transcriptional regulator [Candidatus Obscuribacter sp.]